MKFVSYSIDGEAHYGVLKDRSVIDLTSRLPYRNFVEFIASGDDHPIQELLESEHGDYLYENLRLLPVVPEAGKILCIGLNYHDHVAEADRKLGGRETIGKVLLIPEGAA